eukprot:scaffold13929_cov128-Skeletonema_marinoi.AAC.1
MSCRPAIYQDFTKIDLCRVVEQRAESVKDSKVKVSANTKSSRELKYWRELHTITFFMGSDLLLLCVGIGWRVPTSIHITL